MQDNAVKVASMMKEKRIGVVGKEAATALLEAPSGPTLSHYPALQTCLLPLLYSPELLKFTFVYHYQLQLCFFSGTGDRLTIIYT